MWLNRLSTTLLLSVYSLLHLVYCLISGLFRSIFRANMTENSDIAWFERFKKECDLAGFAVTCPNCMKVMRDSKTPAYKYLPSNNCFCSPPIDYDEVAEAHGLGLFSSMFHFTENMDVRPKLGLAR